MKALFPGAAEQTWYDTSTQKTKVYTDRCLYTERQEVEQILKHKDLLIEVSYNTTGMWKCWIPLISLRSSVVGWGTTPQVGRLRVRIPMRSLDFSNDLILPAALWPWGRLSPKQKWVPRIFLGVKGDRRVRLTTSPCVSQLSWKCGILDDSKLHRPPRHVAGIALPFYQSSQVRLESWRSFRKRLEAIAGKNCSAELQKASFLGKSTSWVTYQRSTSFTFKRILHEAAAQ
jgi:hypothetical protein